MRSRIYRGKCLFDEKRGLMLITEVYIEKLRSFWHFILVSPPDSIHKNADLIILKQALFKLNRNRIKLIKTSVVRLCISNIHQLQFGWNEPLIQSVGCETGSEHLMMSIQKHEAQRRPVSSSRCVNVMICDNEAFVCSFTDSGSVYRESWCQSSLQRTNHAERLMMKKGGNVDY